METPAWLKSIYNKTKSISCYIRYFILFELETNIDQKAQKIDTLNKDNDQGIFIWGLRNFEDIQLRLKCLSLLKPELWQRQLNKIVYREKNAQLKELILKNLSENLKQEYFIKEAKNSKDPKNREWAVMNLDPIRWKSQLEVIFESDPDSKVRTAASQKLNFIKIQNIHLHVLQNIADRNQRLGAVEKLDSNLFQAELVDLATDDKEPIIRAACLRKVSDQYQAKILSILQNEPEQFIREIALQKIDALLFADELTNLAKNEMDGTFRNKIIEKLSPS